MIHCDGDRSENGYEGAGDGDEGGRYGDGSAGDGDGGAGDGDGGTSVAPVSLLRIAHLLID